VDRAGAAVRIARAPARDRRTASGVGRDARLELVFELRGGRTVAAHVYAEAPFRPVRTFDAGGAAYAILVAAAPGVFGGDRLSLSVSVEAGARVLLASQSALQVHPSAPAAPAIIEQRYRVASGAELYCEWDPVIPFTGARLDQRFALDVSSDSRLFWSDALMCGRAGSGETWQFAELAHELRLSVDGELEYLERYRLRPEARAGTGRWQAGDHPYVGTVLARDAALADLALLEALQRELAAVEGTVAAVDAPVANVAAARVLANGGPPFAHARRIVRDRLCEAWLGRSVSFRR
jgi:urease accessory protein